MRWKYLNLHDPEDGALRAEKLAAIERWWQAFVAKAKDLQSLFTGKSEWDLPAWMHEHLGAIDPSICWEYGPAIHTKGHRLVVTPESNRGLRPLVTTLLEHAPELPGWEFYPHRLPEVMEILPGTMEARTGGDVSDVLVQVARVGEHHVGLRFLGPRTTSDGDKQAMHDAFVAAETLLGEEWLDHWIGPIEVAPLSAAQSGDEDWPTPPMPLSRLYEAVKSTIAWIRDDLPERPYYEWADDASWSGFELQPEEGDDFPERMDLIALITCNQELAAATFRPGFHSERFSRRGETFCYLKIDGSDGLEPGGFEDREDMEEALLAVLKPDGLGTVCGGGTGLRYSYIDLALTDVEKCIPLIQEALRAGKIPFRTWLLFHDAYLCDEWIGIYDDTPAPPRAD